SPVNDIAELAATDQLAAVDLVRRLPVRPGEESAPEVVGLPICFDRQRPRSARSAPKLGEHTREVLGDGSPGNLQSGFPAAWEASDVHGIRILGYSSQTLRPLPVQVIE